MATAVDTVSRIFPVKPIPRRRGAGCGSTAAVASSGSVAIVAVIVGLSSCHRGRPRPRRTSSDVPPPCRAGDARSERTGDGSPGRARVDRRIRVVSGSGG
ncbi:hypothetical protein CHO01_16190 [Cellulomonas hominis]|uniref:Uncharacterized protein n=1 Tax=Cellulomonas hominis TaxID=156981 RepID=A0A511FBA5_9CELL|nr:hypothetical protein CHO01_16190 [Cellulomonas hominis]